MGIRVVFSTGLNPKVACTRRRRNTLELTSVCVCMCVDVSTYLCICMLGGFKQGLQLKTLAALRSSQTLMLKVCERLAHPITSVSQSCCKERYSWEL